MIFISWIVRKIRYYRYTHYIMHGNRKSRREKSSEGEIMNKKI